VTISEAAHAEQLNAERVSRLCSRTLPAFESTLAALTRIGRPQRSATQEAALGAHHQLLIARSLLAVATSILRHVSLRKPAVRSLILGAWLRLSAEHCSLTQKQFCATLALSPRTLRSWRLAAPAPAKIATPAVHNPPPPPPRKRPPRRRRFSFDVVLPDTQLTADTTDLRALGMPLKLIAAQDIGGRDQDLLDSVIVDDHESAELVVAALREAIDDRTGLQVVVDQGTPYMAAATRAALEELGAEHAPQREATPTDKATIERAFGSVKTYARPLLALSDRIAALLPQLRRPELAKALTTLVLTALLRAYQGGARAAQRADAERAGLDRQTLHRVAEQARESVRVQDESVRLRLQWIYRTYGFPDRSEAEFINAFRRFPLRVIVQAEAAFGAQAHRADIVRRTAYFAKIARGFNENYRAARVERRRQQARDLQWQADVERVRAERAARQDDPIAGLRAALDILPAYWDSSRQQLCGNGAGPGRVGTRKAIERLVELHGPTAAADIVTATLRDFTTARADQLQPTLIAAIDGFVRRFLPPPKASPTLSCVAAFASTILGGNGQTQHPPPS
jgi:hypothetical protein